MKINIIAVCFALSQFVYGVQRGNYPKVGKPCPDFTINNVEYYSSKQLSLSDLKGKNIILDFWSTGCGACIASFPKMNEIQKKFEKDLSIVLIGLEEKSRDVSKFYDVIRKRSDLELISGYDSTLFRRFVPLTVPHLIWIDKDGIIKAITSSDNINEDAVDKFIKGEEFEFNDRSYLGAKASKLEIDNSIPLLIEGNGGEPTDYVFRSVLSKWQLGKGATLYRDIESFVMQFREGRYQAIKASPLILYWLAYCGTTSFKKLGVHSVPDIKSDKPTPFDSNGEFYNYSIEVPYNMASKDKMMRCMQNDLENYFGYRGTLVIKDIPCYKLTVIDRVKFESTYSDGGVAKMIWRLEELENTLQNTSVESLTLALGLYINDKIFVNDTGTKQNINLTLSAKIDNIESIRKGLNTYGLDLIPSTISKKVLEIYPVE